MNVQSAWNALLLPQHLVQRPALPLNVNLPTRTELGLAIKYGRSLCLLRQALGVQAVSNARLGAAQEYVAAIIRARAAAAGGGAQAVPAWAVNMQASLNQQQVLLNQLQASINQQHLDLVRVNNRGALHSTASAPIMPLRNAAGAIAPGFPTTRIEYDNMVDPSNPTQVKLDALSSILNFYGCVDPTTGAVFPVQAPALAGAALQAELRRLGDAFKAFLS